MLCVAGYLVTVSESNHIKTYIHSIRSFIDNSYPADCSAFRMPIVGDCSRAELVKRESLTLVTIGNQPSGLVLIDKRDINPIR